MIRKIKLIVILCMVSHTVFSQLNVPSDKIRFSEARGIDYDPLKDAIFYNGYNYGQVSMLSDLNGNAWYKGKVGIGLITSHYKLSIKPESETYSVFLTQPNTENAGWVFGAMTNGNLNFARKTSSTTYAPSLSIDLDGNVGIGTVSPESKFHVSGTMRWGGNAEFSYNYPYNEIRWGDNTAWYLSFNRRSDGEKLITIRSSDGFTYYKGNVGIGTTDTRGFKLAVKGKIGAGEIEVKSPEYWPDYVFSSNYNLKPLTEVETFIEENNHLPDIPSEKEVKEKGINLGDMDAKLLQKIEELTLYMIEQNKKTEALLKRTESLEKENQLLKEEVKSLKEK